MSNCRLTRPGHIAIFVAVILTAQSAQSYDSWQNREAMKLIENYAVKMCGYYAYSGETSKLRIKGHVAAMTGAFLKKLANLGIKGAATYQRSKYFGPPRSQAVAANGDVRKCRLMVHNDWVDRLIPRRTKRTNSTGQTTVTTTGKKSPIINHNKGNVTININ